MLQKLQGGRRDDIYTIADELPPIPASISTDVALTVVSGGG